MICHDVFFMKRPAFSPGDIHVTLRGSLGHQVTASCRTDLVFAFTEAEGLLHVKEPWNVRQPGSSLVSPHISYTLEALNESRVKSK